MAHQLPSFIPYGRHCIDADDIAAVVEVLRSGHLTQGPKIEEFEKVVASYVGAKYAVALSSGTAALHLACLAAGLGKGDNVITSPNTFVASANCALYVGASPHFSDIDPRTLNIDPFELEKTCKKLKTVKAIIPVHFAGLPCDMEKVKRIATQFNSIVIEDAAHALGSIYPNGKKVGCCENSNMTVFSFHPVKLIAAGEGGMITTNDQTLYEKLLLLRTHGIIKDTRKFKNHLDATTNEELNPWYYEMQELGFNYRITDIQCALGLSQFKKIELFLKRRRNLAVAYDDAFNNHPFISPVQIDGRNQSAHHIYVVRFDFKKWGKTRTFLMKKLLEKSIGTQVHYIPVYHQPAYLRLGYKREDFPACEAYYAEALTLPLYFELSDQDQRYVVDSIRSLSQ